VKLDTLPAGGLWTYEEFAKLPSERWERYEVIAGELYVTRVPSMLHQAVVFGVLKWIYPFVELDNRLGAVFPGPIDVLFAIGDFLAPDAAFVRGDRMEIVTDRGIEVGAPDLVVEVVSEATAERDRGIKRERYALYGVPEYWIVDAELRTVEVYRLADDPVRPAFVATKDFPWRPSPGGPILTLNVPELLRGHDELREILDANEKRDRQHTDDALHA
jgi:Uma2 family endonuclease